ncbi:MAG: hypothetical protein ABS46_19695 [Cytophagaceae bacterium SCN 52-12]|nr:MAG: hypothetical protein ABS46_19695 [Cytophagaceae bacterium SCN 52-12]
MKIKTNSNERPPGWARMLTGGLETGYNRLPAIARIVIGVVFFVSVATYSALLIRDGIRSQSQQALSITGIQPGTVAKGNDLPSRLSRDEYDKLLKAQESLDSLKRICSPCYNEFLLVHPGFADSLKQILLCNQREFLLPQTNQQP